MFFYMVDFRPFPVYLFDDCAFALWEPRHAWHGGPSQLCDDIESIHCRV